MHMGNKQEELETTMQLEKELLVVITGCGGTTHTAGGRGR